MHSIEPTCDCPAEPTFYTVEICGLVTPAEFAAAWDTWLPLDEEGL